MCCQGDGTNDIEKMTEFGKDVKLVPAYLDRKIQAC